MSGERLQKLLAAAGLGSRRQIEQWIRAGRLTVDGQRAILGTRATAYADIRLDGAALPLSAQLAPAARSAEGLLYHKPIGEVTTRSDPQGRPTVFEHLPAPARGRWVVIGRLDVNTSGLLLFSTDGALAHRLMHPSAGIERRYRVRVRGVPDAAVLARLRRGVMLADGAARFERLEGESPRGPRPESSHRWFRATLREGRNREVRRLWEAAGFAVSRLIRVRYGPIALPADLAPGHWRALRATELAALREAVAGPSSPAPQRKPAAAGK